MSLTIAGKNMDVGTALRQRIEDRLNDSLEKYFDGNHSAQVTLSKTGAGFDADCVLHLDTGIVLRASASAGDAIHAFEQAADRIDKRLRRYKRRRKAHSHHARGAEPIATDARQFVLATPPEEEELEANYAPLVVAETPTRIKTMTVGMAVLELDLSDAPAMMFINAANKTLNVVFRRADGNVGWIDPSLAASAEPAGTVTHAGAGDPSSAEAY